MMKLGKLMLRDKEQKEETGNSQKQTIFEKVKG